MQSKGIRVSRPEKMRFGSEEGFTIRNVIIVSSPYTDKLIKSKKLN